MKPSRALYFVGKRLIAQGDIPRHPVPPHSGPMSCAFFCSTCGELWANVVVEGEAWQLFNVPCERHEPTGVPDWSAVPGSLMQHRRSRAEVSTMFWALTADSLPLPLLQREFQLELYHFLRQQTKELA